MNLSVIIYSASIIAATSLSSCGHTGVEENFSRSEDFARITSRTDFSAPSDLALAVGQATYTGVALASFDNGSLTSNDSFTATADVKIIADFDHDTMNGTLTDWTDGDPRNFNLRGEIFLFDGSIMDTGIFTTQMIGNIERTAAGSDLNETPLLLVISGQATGGFYDSLSADEASRVIGDLFGTTDSTTGVIGTLNGGFIAVQ